MDRTELELTDTVQAIDRELRKLRTPHTPMAERQLAARMIHNLAAVALGALQRPAESAPALT